MRVTIPEAAQTRSSRPGAWTSRSISAETMKIPEPIMDPTTRAVASSRESALTKSAWGCWVVAISRGNLVAPAWCRYVFGPRTPYHVRTTVRLLPREEEFFALFVEVATRSTVAAQHLRELFDAPPERRIAHVEAIKRLEHVMDAIDGTARRSQIFHLGPAPQGVKVLTEVIQRMVGVLAEAVGRLKKGDDVMKYCIEAKKLEEEGDAIYQEALGHMFETERDALEIIKWKEIYDNLETTLDQGEDVANVLESITIKHA